LLDIQVKLSVILEKYPHLDQAGAFNEQNYLAQKSELETLAGLVLYPKAKQLITSTQQQLQKDLDKIADEIYQKAMNQTRIAQQQYEYNKNPERLKMIYGYWECPNAILQHPIVSQFQEQRKQMEALIKTHYEQDIINATACVQAGKLRDALKIYSAILNYIPTEKDAESWSAQIIQELAAGQSQLQKKYQAEQAEHERLYGKKLQEDWDAAILTHEYAKAKKILADYQEYRGLEEKLNCLAQRLETLEEIQAYFSKHSPSVGSIQERLANKTGMTKKDIHWVTGNAHLVYHHWESAQAHFTDLAQLGELCVVYQQAAIKGQAEENAANMYLSAVKIVKEAEENYKAQQHALAQEKYLAALKKFYTLRYQMKDVTYCIDNQKLIRFRRGISRSRSTPSTPFDS